MQKFLFLFLFVSFFVACKKKDASLAERALLAHIPTEATAVVEFRTKVLFEKADVEAIKKSDKFQSILKKYDKEAPALAEILRNPAQSGVDLEQNAYMTFLVNSENTEETLPCLLVGIKDAAQFKVLLDHAAFQDFTNKEIYTYCVKAGKIVAWSENFAILAEDKRGTDVIAFFDQFFKLKEEQSMQKKEALLNYFAQNHDISLWATTNAYTKSGGVLSILPNDLKDNFAQGYLDFLKGEITGKVDFLFQEGFKQQIHHVFKDKINSDFAQYIPNTNYQFVASLGVNIKGIYQKLSENIQMRGMIDMVLGGYHVSMEDFPKAFDGDVLVVGLEEGKNLVALKINDKPTAQKFLNAAEGMNLLKKESDAVYSYSNQLNFSSTESSNNLISGKLFVNNDVVVFSDNGALMQKIIGGGLLTSEHLEANRAAALNQSIFSVLSKDITHNGQAAGIEKSDFYLTINQANLHILMKNKEKNALNSYW